MNDKQLNPQAKTANARNEPFLEILTNKLSALNERVNEIKSHYVIQHNDQRESLNRFMLMDPNDSIKPEAGLNEQPQVIVALIEYRINMINSSLDEFEKTIIGGNDINDHLRKLM